MKQLIYKIQALFLFPIFFIYYLIIGKNKRNIIKIDFAVWCKYKNRKYNFFSFLILFAEFLEFRSVVYNRIGVMCVFIKWLFKGQSLLFLPQNIIGPGLLIQHGFGTAVHASKIGENCKIYQEVTIGYNDNSFPTIGNNVTICAGAKVIGGVTIGDDVIVGANAVVVKDIPSHSIVVGVPAKIIKRRNNMNEKWEKV